MLRLLKRDPDQYSGVTLMEVLLAMVILALITASVFSAFVFSRRVTHRSEAQTLIQNYMLRVNEQLRQAISGPVGGWSLNPGIYVNWAMTPKPGNAIVPFPPSPPASPNSPDVLTSSLPNGFVAKFFTSPGDGVYLYVEGPVDFDGDGQIGFDFDGDGITDLKRVTIKVQWTPQAN